jgi:phage protein D
MPLEGTFEARVVSNNYYSPDRFSIRLLRGSARNGLSDYLSLPEATTFNILISLDAGANFISLLTGHGDNLICDYHSGNMRIDGRDLSASFQNTPASGVFANQTSSEIATTLAGRHGLACAAVPTPTMAGRYYHGENSQIAYNQFNQASTEWDLLVFLARCENYDIFVSGNVLYFQPTAIASTVSALLRAKDLISLKLRRRLRLSGDIVASVKSWNSKQSTAIVQTAVSRRLSYASAAGPLGASPTQQYYLVRPNLSATDAAKFAQNQVQELSRHEQCIEFSMPGELSLMARTTFLLQGTNSDFDQIYQIDSIERAFSPSSGFLQHVSAHSISTRETILLPGSV